MVLNASEYGSRWVKWWIEFQPQRRDAQALPSTRDVSDTDWRKFPAHGPDGLFLAIMAMSWWAQAVKLANDVPLFEEAAGNLHQVIQGLIRTRSNNDPPPNHYCLSSVSVSPSSTSANSLSKTSTSILAPTSVLFSPGSVAIRSAHTGSG